MEVKATIASIERAIAAGIAAFGAKTPGERLAFHRGFVSGAQYVLEAARAAREEARKQRATE